VVYKVKFERELIMDSKIRKKGLGRGLSTLLAETNNDSHTNTKQSPIVEMHIPIEKIFPNPKQPRRRFDKEKLQELAKSILNNGIIQPVIVRLKGSDYELVAGERRWRAAQISQIHSLPVIVRELTDEQAAEYSIVENIQREDLTAIEEARSYKNLLEIYNYTQEEISVALGKSRSYIANMLRLLSLPNVIVNLLEDSKISIGHARALIGLPEAVKISKKIMKDRLSVRQTEALVKKIKESRVSSFVNEAMVHNKDIDTLNLEKNLTYHTKFKITIDHKKSNNKGKLSINYNTLDELDRICNYLYSK
tara:strand:+ start:26 stop:946 length:921 start_codon:yes stop_codon:yes gene_type:complete